MLERSLGVLLRAKVFRAEPIESLGPPPAVFLLSSPIDLIRFLAPNLLKNILKAPPLSALLLFLVFGGRYLTSGLIEI